MFYAFAIAPALVTLVLIAMKALSAGKHYWVFSFAALGCLISAATPWFCIWFVWNVLNDHTANIEAALLVFGQPLIAPIGAMSGALLGSVIEAAVKRRGER